MNSSAAGIPATAGRVPMLAALVPVVAGILCAGLVALPLWCAAVGFGVCMLAARMSRRRAAADACMCLALLLAGWIAAELRYDPRPLPASQAVAEIVVDAVTARRESATLADGRLIAFRCDGATVVSGGRIRIAADPSLGVVAGERMVAVCGVVPFSRGDTSSYRRYMARRGFAGQTYIRPRDVLRRTAEEPSAGNRMRAWAVERVERLGLPRDISALAEAVAVGERLGIEPEVRRRYSLAGAAHLLAVSGLHVGFVFVMVNLLLWWMPAVKRGHRWRSAAAVAAIWLYAAVAGFSPSVTRAAVMFTLLQLSVGFSSGAGALDRLAFAVCVMLLFDARTLYDAGFQLSCVAVAAIAVWGVPLSRAGTDARRRRRDLLPDGGRRTYAERIALRALRWLRGAVAVSLAASVATLPLSALMFGTVSLWSVAAGPATVMLSAVMLAATLAWILLPLPALAPAAAWTIGMAGRGLDAVVEWCAAAGVVSGEVSIGAPACAAIYVVFVLLTLLLRTRPGWSGGGR